MAASLRRVRFAACAWLAAVLLVGVLGSGAAQATACAEHVVVIATGEAEHRFQVELAETPAEQSRGLMFRQRLPIDAGMLFLKPQPSPAAFWMRNTYIPLDIIFIAEGGIIESIAAETTPLSEALIPSQGPVRAILEINGGLSEALGLKPGHMIRHPALQRPWPNWRC